LNGLLNLDEIFRDCYPPADSPKSRKPEVDLEIQDGGGRHIDFIKIIITKPNIDRSQ
jgi:hypothetical protein